MQDQPPQNRAARRAALHKRPAKGPALVHQPSPSRSAPHGPAIGTGEPSEAPISDSDDADGEGASPFAAFMGGADRAPADRKVSHHKGGSKQGRIRDTLVTYYALAGMAVARLDRADGELIVANAANCADAWIAAGKANPQIMRALEVITVAGPYTALIMVHAQVALAVMDRHGASPFAALFARPAVEPVGPARQRPEQRPEPAPLPYQPVGPGAPTEAPAAPLAYEELRVIPDEGLPADLDVALRQLARETRRPYEELRQEALVALAQDRMQQNGHHVGTPGALGAPIAKE